ncbi:EamA/RhaT family transporter [Streptomyces sp. ISL-12]|uniref:EamA/RhaT family transporter n=1 Tax=Streptomyces sp. ISL-12 TaxID=2819177 RepID=UPI001BE92321|nr:EamA/RhaT family transporter [Streptomyces sp. ISL-12]MBT2414531.1 EamA/RhaT family transporter [Streptomyces sp. ISL-12]
MSEENGSPETTGTAAGTPGNPTTGPRPEPIRFFGTTWLHHDGAYTARRLALAAGALVLAAAACLVLRLAYQGLQIAEIGSFVTVLVIVMFAVCSALAFGHTWGAFTTRPAPDRQASLRGLLTVGFLGSLLAYALRCLIEAPGEKLHRAEYETAVAQHKKRTTRRSGNPKKRRR